MPFLDQMFYTCFITIAVIAMVSLTTSTDKDDPKAIELTADVFKTDRVFNICAYAICVLVVVIYSVFW